MNIQRLPLSQLKPAPYNPRRALRPGDPRFERLARSLGEFELVQPLVWNRRTGHLVGGHQRVEILKHRGATEVDCVVVDLSLEREKALNVALNNPEVGGDWDADKLHDLLSELQDLPDVDVTLTGFDERQLTALLMRPTGDDLDEDEDDANVVTATLEIPRDAWPAAEGSLNAFLRQTPGVRLHVRE
jgi:ParB-like chromosome segregation protein Spo0J